MEVRINSHHVRLSQAARHSIEFKLTEALDTFADLIRCVRMYFNRSVEKDGRRELSCVVEVQTYDGKIMRVTGTAATVRSLFDIVIRKIKQVLSKRLSFVRDCERQKRLRAS